MTPRAGRDVFLGDTPAINLQAGIRERLVARHGWFQFLRLKPTGEVDHICIGQGGRKPRHDRVLTFCHGCRGLNPKIMQLLDEVIGMLPGQLRIRRRRAVAVRSMASGADLFGDLLASSRIGFNGSGGGRRNGRQRCHRTERQDNHGL